MKHRYRYHHEHLVFVKEKRSLRKILWRLVFFLLSIALLTVAYYIAYSLFFDTPEERALKRENVLLEEESATLTAKMDQIEELVKQLQNRDQEIYQAIFHADMSPLHSNSDNSYEAYSSLSNSGLVTRNTKVMLDLNARAMTLSLLMNKLTLHFKNAEKDSLRSMPLLQPIENEGLTRIGASIGMRIHPFYKLLKRHTGIDFIAGLGTDVYATGAGRVTLAEHAQRGTGSRVEIDHGNGYVTTYSHLSDVLVQTGSTVKRGQVIGRVGNTGMSVYPHLHYEVMKNGVFMDPLNYFFIGLLPDDYDILRQLSTSSGQSLD